MGPEQRGLWLGLGAFVLWGLFPLYWPLLGPLGPVEMLAHRTVWSLVLVIAMLAVGRDWAWIAPVAREPAVWGRIAVAAATLTFNWGVYIHAVTTGRVVEAALGYFIAPLLLTGLGITLFGERLRPARLVAVLLAAGAVFLLVAAYGRVPWLAFALAGSWAVYGYLKKTVNLPAVRSLAVETAAMFLPAAGYLAWLAWRGDGAFVTAGPGRSLMLATTGLAVVPLLLFAAAANRVELSTLGLMQYVEPALQFGIGVVILHEEMPASRWAGFALIWAALVLLTHDSRRATAPRAA